MYDEKAIQRRPPHTSRSVRMLWRWIFDQVGKGLKVQTPPRIHIQIEDDILQYQGRCCFEFDQNSR